MTSATTSAWPGDGFVHEVLLYGSDAELGDRVVPFVEEARAAEEPVLVVAGARVRSLLLDHFGAGVQDFTVFADADEQWVGAAQTMAWYRDSVAPLAERRPCRLVAEPTWMSQPWGEVWTRYDAVANDLFADLPCYCLCLHDRHRVPQPLLDAALQVHPLVWGGTQPVASPRYLPTDTFLRSVEPNWGPAPADRESRVVSAAAEARRLVASALPRPAPEEVRDDVTLAVNELVVNAIEATGAAEVSHWREGESMVWQVSDDGPGMHATSAGYVPPPADEINGRGLWIARTLADDAVVRPHGPGTAIRLFFSGPLGPSDS
jgi:anti-sigma regulatory factor (Ser/Thr protein kinase)